MSKRNSLLVGLGIFTAIGMFAIARSHASEPDPYRIAIAAERKSLIQVVTLAESQLPAQPVNVRVEPRPALPVLKRTLPGYHCYSLTYKVGTRPAGLGYTFVVGPHGQGYRFWKDTDNSREFTRLLKDGKVKSQSAQDARNVRDIYCAVSRSTVTSARGTKTRRS